ncbi:streptomycin biosynthesis protein StrI [Macroventuria anomochaeta]|uniref:Streptomycin biosynthesis protein StrI n=1 Tax=Macroventuria anomochaeta TaxID=301207 RepID=A0ACB6SIQ2_9PLEO|nr:streptomycin biosynthesis protein StrI [Macroventuria anomochaeta]KAF2633964.1 streptomycin biosynthesis protein StrI [Macroventuria anomochaeta]
MAPYLSDNTTSDTNSDSHEAYLKAPDFQNFDNPPRVLVIGAGSRGTAYAEAALEGTNTIIAAVCEPIHSKREAFGKRFIWTGKWPAQPGQHFFDWQQWVEWEEERREDEVRGRVREPGIDAVFVCVLDEMHEEVVCGIAHLGVHICCEKPLSTRLESCIRMYKALKYAKKSNDTVGGKKEPIFGICHVLRYSPHNMLLRHLVRDKNVIGDVLSIEHCEPVGWWHFSHSYVRGNWRKESTSAPSLLTKSCHDIDFLMWMLCTPSSSTSTPHLPSHITSTGSLKYFRKSHKPAAAGSATNCLSCAHESSCSYSAKKIYLDKHLAKGNADWPVKIVNSEIEDIYKTQGAEAAKSQLLADLAEDYDVSTPLGVRNKRNYFGRCVWDSDNDVCDDQMVTLSWEDDGEDARRGAKTALFHMIAQTEKQCERRGRIYGTKGEIEYDSTTISIHDFATNKTTRHVPHAAGGGHGGGDAGLARQFLMAVNAVDSGDMRTYEAQRAFLGCDLEEAFRSHAVVFAAEDARVQRLVVDWETWWKENVESQLAS